MGAAGNPGARIVALGQMMADGAQQSGSPELAAAVATAVQQVLLTSVCRGFSFGESASGIAPGAAPEPEHHSKIVLI